MCNRTLAIYCFIDDFLKARRHREDCRIEVTDSEVITIALTAMLDFGGNAREKSAYFVRTWVGQKTFESFQVFASRESFDGFDSLFDSPTRELFETIALGIAILARFVSDSNLR